MTPDLAIPQHRERPPLTIGSLFSGIGGLELGLERAGLGPVIWQAESDPFARRVLAKHWPGVRIYGDVREIDERAARPDIICGGFPCQDISFAGGGAGIDGARSGLWSEFLRILRVLRPRVAVVENVPALLVRGMGRVLGDLARIGFDAEWDCVSACSVGAPHVRRRVFVVAHADSLHGWAWLRDSKTQQAWAVQGGNGGPRASAREQVRLEDPSALYGGAHGVPDGMDRNRTIGNAVHPDVAEFIGRAILACSPPLTQEEA